MNQETIFAQWFPLLKKYWLPLILGSLGLILFAYGLIALFGSIGNSQKITFSSDSTQTASTQSIASQIQVDVEGAVISPGVYKLSLNSIIQDALVAAGGLSSDADRDWVAKNLNLAAKLADGAKVYIPKLGAETVLGSESLGAIGQSSALININTASAQDLDSLPGVGPATATKIINGRPYSDLNQLLDSKTVSQKVFDEIKDKISIY